MAGTIIVLGPSEWLGASDGKRVLDAKPLDVRRRIVAAMKPFASSFVLEDEKQREHETNIEFLLRTLKERDVQKFVVFWPYGARLHGLGIEAGHLLSELAHDRLDPRFVVVLAERRALRVDPSRGVFEFAEPGNRTRYYQDLVAYGCPIRRWTTEASLLRLSRAIAFERALS